MITFTPEFLRERIYACWIGKNIGGTLGAPYEGKPQILDVTGFTSKPGEPLPNDDLDLQLVWLRAVNDYGPDAINSKILGEYWLSWINPNWNEYGVCKANMRDGILPPMSGEIDNEQWKHSNGAWIRTEVWACLYPAMVENAIRLAFEDASVDHGYGEGTYAAIFVAAMESAAFVINDIRSLLNIGLSKIPEDCHVARSVRVAIDAYDKGIDWKDARNLIVKDNEDLGWFQAPGNVAFVVLGLLYGEGDFKKSMLYAINCGDDTDCTGATIGALMGIMGGMAVIPEDWRAYIGDGIKSICLTNGHGPFPTDCTQLTDCIMNLLPTTLRKDHQKMLLKKDALVELGDANDFSNVDANMFCGRKFVESFAGRKQYSYVIESTYADVLVEFDEKPIITENGTLSGAVTLLLHQQLMPEQKRFRLSYLTPEGWWVDSAKNTISRHEGFNGKVEFTIHADGYVEPVNRVVLEVVCAGRATPILVPITVLG